ncbi:MAG TPA: thiamine pyrophosphate-binding protein [Candidatus Limnocylindrales bacterium]|jgi:acetolactate synthase-1/2/3 large subunit
MRVVDAVAQWFDTAGIKHYFGYAGGAIWPLMDGLVGVPHIKGYQAKNEAHATHMADVYYRITGRLAPVVVSKGPGLMNTVGATASAMHDSTAVMIIAGSGSTHFLGRAGMQEMYYHGFEDAVSVFRPITKGAWLIVRPDQVVDVLNTAMKVATSGRPGPVFVQLPYDIQLAEVEGEIELPARRMATSTPHAPAAHIDEVKRLIAAAEKPILLVGGGVNRSAGGRAALAELADKLQVPVATTLPAKGALPEDHPLSLGPTGRSGSHAAVRATREADLVLAVGARFSDNHTSNWRKGMVYDVPQTKIVQVDIDPLEIGRNYAVELGVVSDAGDFLRDLADAVDGQGVGDHSAWLRTVQGFRDDWADEIAPVLAAPGPAVHPGWMVHQVGQMLPERAHVLIDVGDVIQYAEPYLEMRQPGAWHINSGMAEMGWASQGGPGAVVADPGSTAVVLTGDGAFLMGPQVIATAVEYGLKTIWIILNNYELTIERKGSEASYKRTHPWVYFKREDTGEPYNPDFAAMAKSFGADGEQVERQADFRAAFQRALDSDKPYVLDVIVDVSVPSYFVQGITRAYPDKWAESYPGYGLLTVKR